MRGVISNIGIKGITAAVPCNSFDNMAYASAIEDKKLKKSVKLTGIYNRRVTVGSQKASDLAACAADKLLTKLGWDRNSIDVMIYVTQSEELSRPSTAFIIQDRLGIGKQCMVFDINQGCTGYIVGLITLSGMLQQIKGRGLLLVGESNASENGTLSGSQLLEGDAAAATALEYDESAAPINYLNYCDGSRADLLFSRKDNYGYMDGNAILLFGLSDVADAVKQYMSENALSDSDIDYYVFHQAQKMIIDGIVREVGINEEKVLYSCDAYGNTSSAAIPITLCREGVPHSGAKKVLMCGYGIGLTWGMMLVDLDMSVIDEIIETDYEYGDMDKFFN